MNCCRKLSIIAFAFFISIIAFESSFGQRLDKIKLAEEFGTTWNVKFGDENLISTFKSRLTKLDEEISLKPHEFAGTYNFGDEFHQHYFVWTPNGGFVYLHVFENFMVYGAAYGRVKLTPDEINLETEYEYDLNYLKPKSQTKISALVPVKWKGKYLIPVNQIPRFADYVAGLGEFNNLNVFCCMSSEFLRFHGVDENHVSSSQPILPDKYRRFIKKPLDAKITFVGKQRIGNLSLFEGLYQISSGEKSLFSIRINAGKNQGVRRKMIFTLLDQLKGQFVIVTQVNQKSSSGFLVRELDDKKEEYCFSNIGEFKPVKCQTIKSGALITTDFNK